MADKLDTIFDQVTGHGNQITANGLYSLRREVIAQAREGKWSALSEHAARVLERAVALYNKTSSPPHPLRLVNAIDEYPSLGVSDVTVRFEHGEDGLEAQGGHPEPALSFHRFVKRQGLSAAFRDPSAPRRLPYVAGEDRTSSGRTVIEILNELDLGQDGELGSVRDVQRFLNQHKETAAARLDEDNMLGPLSVNAIRERIIARAQGAVLPLQFRSLIHSAQVLFQDMKATAMEQGRITASGGSTPALHVNPLYDGELRQILEDRIKAVAG